MPIPTIYDLKPRFQALLRPLVGRLVAMGFTANQVTLAGLVLSALGGVLIWVTGGHWAALLLLPVILFIRMALNAIDGMMAREHEQASPLGMLLNELTDVGADAVLYLPLMVHPDVPGVWLALVVAAGIVVEMAGTLAPLLGVDRRYDGPFGKSDRAVAFGLLAVLLAFGFGGAWVGWALAVALGLALWTIARRCRAALTGED